MGTDARLMILGGPNGVVNRATRMLEDLEAQWSRFRPDSELQRLNRRARGIPVRISPSTFALVARAVDAWRRTGGYFDPTGLDAVVALGYDRDFARVAARRDTDGPPVSGDSVPLPGCRDIVLDPMVSAVTLPPGVTLDLGGIGKGYAADLIATDLIDAGAAAVCVDLGGDLRVMGPGPYDGAWEIGFDAVPRDAEPRESRAPIRIASGAVATSTLMRRTWMHGGDVVHHLLDPTTGASARSGLSTVTVIAGEAWWAEVVAKAVFVAGPERGSALLNEFGLSAILVADDGVRTAVGTHWS